MARSRNNDDVLTPLPIRDGDPRWKRWAVVIGVPIVLVLVAFLIFWKMFFHYVPAGKHLVIISKSGEPLDVENGEILADEGQKGIQKKVLGEGYHFILPIVNETELRDNTVIPPGKVGIVTALGGVHPRGGRVLAEEEDEQGIRRQVLLPGNYRLNTHGYKVDIVDMIKIEPGFIGVKRRLLGKEGAEPQFATRPTEKGILKDEILQPGLYPINTKEYEVVKCEVGIYQTTYLYSRDAGETNSALTFYGQGGAKISLDATVEWEVKPEHWPLWLTRFRSHREIETKVIDLHAKQIAQVRGANYSAEDFLEGKSREKFQEDFRKGLDTICNEENVLVRSAFIRNIIIPEKFLSEKREQRIAVEMELTSKELTITAGTEAEVSKAKKGIDARVKEVEAETIRMAAVVARDTENVKALTEAEIEKMKAEYGARIAELEAEQKKVLGEAEAEATKLKETAKSTLYKMKMDVFKSDGDAFLRYSMAQQLNPKMQLRLFHAGPGTLWTNMGNKNMNFMMPLAKTEKVESAAKAEK